jgi:hypothetical protein
MLLLKLHSSFAEAGLDEFSDHVHVLQANQFILNLAVFDDC